MSNINWLILDKKGYEIYKKYGWIENFAKIFNNIWRNPEWDLEVVQEVPSIIQLNLCQNVYSFQWTIVDKNKHVSMTETDICSNFITTGFTSFGKIFNAIQNGSDLEKKLANKVFKTYIRIYSLLQDDDKKVFGKEIINGLTFCNFKTVNDIDISILKNISSIVRTAPEIVDYIYIFDNYHKDNDAIMHEFLNLLQDEERFKIILNMYKYADKLDRRFFEYNLISALSMIKNLDEIKDFMVQHKELKDIRKLLGSLNLINNEIIFSDKYLLDKYKINLNNFNSALEVVNKISGENFVLKTRGELKLFNENKESPRTQKIIKMLYNNLCFLGCLLDAELSTENLTQIRNDILVICGEEVKTSMNIKRKKI